MNEKHMQYILAVLKEGSFTAAARKLYISQPSLSQAIKAAETSLGAAIFDRSTDPVSLTPADASMWKRQSQISSISSNLKKQVEELNREESGLLRLGISVQRGMELLPVLYPRFRAQFPHVSPNAYGARLRQPGRNGAGGARWDIALLTAYPRYEGPGLRALKRRTAGAAGKQKLPAGRADRPGNAHRPSGSGGRRISLKQKRPFGAGHPGRSLDRTGAYAPQGPWKP